MRRGELWGDKNIYRSKLGQQGLGFILLEEIIAARFVLP